MCRSTLVAVCNQRLLPTTLGAGWNEFFGRGFWARRHWFMLHVGQLGQLGL